MMSSFMGEQFYTKGFIIQINQTFRCLFLRFNVIKVKIGFEDELQKTKAVSYVIRYACCFLYFVSMPGFAFLSPS